MGVWSMEIPSPTLNHVCPCRLRCEGIFFTLDMIGNRRALDLLMASTRPDGVPGRYTVTATGQDVSIITAAFA